MAAAARGNATKAQKGSKGSFLVVVFIQPLTCPRSQALPPFGWSTEPVLGSEEVIEEAFLGTYIPKHHELLSYLHTEVFCDLIYGGGWADREKEKGGEESWLERECSWALVRGFLQLCRQPL